MSIRRAQSPKEYDQNKAVHDYFEYISAEIEAFKEGKSEFVQLTEVYFQLMRHHQNLKALENKNKEIENKNAHNFLMVCKNKSEIQKKI